jgi:transglutaminase-like putative cysteine protease
VLRRSGVVFACLLALLVAAFPAPGSAATQHRFAPDPDWVELLPVRGDAETTASDGARYLLVDDQVSLLGAEPVWHRRLVEQVVHERGLASAARLSIDFQPLYQRVEIHSVELLRGGERIDRRPRADVQVLRRESDMESGILDGRLTVQITIPDVRVGDRIDYRFSVVGANPIFGGDYHDVFSLGYGVALAERRIRFLVPPGTVLRHSVDRPEYRVAQGRGDGSHSLEFTASNLPRIVEDDATPRWHDAYGHLRVSTLADWPAVARWAGPLYPRRLGDRALAGELAARLGLDPADPQGSMERAIAFVQGEVRYTAIDMGSHSYAPSPPETTLERRFGDCKDKSTLLVSLLAEAGIEAEPVLVNTVARAAVRDRLPSPLAFDHVVVRARTADGDVWIDPTRDRERAPLAGREPLPFRYGLPVHADGGLVEIPAPPSARPEVEVTQRIRLDAAGGRAHALFGVVTDYRRGEAEGRRIQYEDNAPREIGDRYLAYMRGFYDGIDSVGVPGTSDAGEQGTMRTVESYRLDWDTTQHGRGFGIVLFQLADWLPRLKSGARTMPLLLEGPSHATHTIRVDYPRGWSIAPGHALIENPWFSFERHVEVHGDDLVVTGTWRRHAEAVPAGEYTRFRGDIEAARELLAFDVDLDERPAILLAGAGAWAWPAVSFAVLGALLSLAWWRRRRDPVAGMLFAPRATMAGLLAEPRGTWPVAALMVATALVGVGPELAQWSVDDDGASTLVVVGLVSTLAWFPLFALLLKGCFRMLSTRSGFGDLLRATAWACVPYILFMLIAGVALGGRIAILADADPMLPAHVPGLLAALLLVVAGLCWYLVAMINAYAVAARTGRGRVVGALALGFLMLSGLVLVLGLLAVVVYFSLGGGL